MFNVQRDPFLTGFTGLPGLFCLSGRKAKKPIGGSLIEFAQGLPEPEQNNIKILLILSG